MDGLLNNLFIRIKSIKIDVIEDITYFNINSIYILTLNKYSQYVFPDEQLSRKYIHFHSD